MMPPRSRTLRRLVSGMLGACLIQAQAAEPAAPPAHHRPQGYQNNDIEFAPKSLRDLIAWRWNALREGLPRPPQAPTPAVAPDLAFIHANAKAGLGMQPAATWIGQIGRAHV